MNTTEIRNLFQRLYGFLELNGIVTQFEDGLLIFGTDPGNRSIYDYVYRAINEKHISPENLIRRAFPWKEVKCKHPWIIVDKTWKHLIGETKTIRTHDNEKQPLFKSIW